MSQPWSYHVFSLPKELLDTLVPRNVVNQAPNPLQEDPLPPVAPSRTEARACNVCMAAVFADVDSQRAHYRSDWHRYNVKAKSNGGNPVSESHFAQLVDSECVRSVWKIARQREMNRSRGLALGICLVV